MNNQLLKILAGLLAMGAVGVAYLGMRLSQQPAPAAPAPVVAASQPTFSVLVAARALPAGQAIKASDLISATRNALPDRALTSPQSAVGRIPTRDIAQGEAIQEGMFLAPRLANLLKQGERAVGVRIDEVVGLGGFAEPGDAVDVLVFLTSNRETNEVTTASIAIHGARLLAFGTESLLSQTEVTPDSAAQQAKEVSGAKDVEKAADRQLNLKSAVLAVPMQDAARLMLATSQGQIKLALRPAADLKGSNDLDSETLRTGLVTAPGNALRTGTVTLSELAQVPKSAKAASPNVPAAPRPPATMEIFEGSSLRKVPL